MNSGKKIQCPNCKGNMEKIKDKIAEDGVEFEAYRCTSCGEELLSMPQLKSLATKYRAMRKAKEITFAKWGNSIAVRIPKEMAGTLKIRAGKRGFINQEKDGIKIVPA